MVNVATTNHGQLGKVSLDRRWHEESLRAPRAPRRAAPNANRSGPGHLTGVCDNLCGAMNFVGGLVRCVLAPSEVLRIL